MCGHVFLHDMDECPAKHYETLAYLRTLYLQTNPSKLRPIFYFIRLIVQFIYFSYNIPSLLPSNLD